MPIINLNFTEYMGGGDRWQSEAMQYAATVDLAIQDGKLSGPFHTTCPECDVVFTDTDEVHADTDHVIVNTTSDTFAVVIACEGYYVVNPNLVGIDSPNWTDLDGNVPV